MSTLQSVSLQMVEMASSEVSRIFNQFGRLGYSGDSKGKKSLGGLAKGAK